MKKLKIYLLSVLSVLAITSCVDDNVFTPSEGDYIVGFKNATPSYIYTALDPESVDIFEPIDLIGGSTGTSSSEDIIIDYQIDPSSTALPGTHYQINNTGSTLTLLAGQDFVKFPLTIFPTALPANEPLTIIVNLTQVSTGNAVVLERRKSITITIAKCESVLAGNYNLTVTRLDNNTDYLFPNEVITELSIGRYVTSSTGPYGPGSELGTLVEEGAPRDGFIFNDVCQSIVIQEQNLGDYYTNLVYGNVTNGSQGTVELSPETGDVVSITMYYIITFSNNAVLRPFKAVYTKI